MAALNGGRSLMNEAGGRFTMVALWSVDVGFDRWFSGPKLMPGKWKCSPAHSWPIFSLALWRAEIKQEQLPMRTLCTHRWLRRYKRSKLCDSVFDFGKELVFEGNR